MAGSHKVKVSKPGTGFWFEVAAKPANRLSRIPTVGPFISYNLGRNPKFQVDVRYLGYVFGNPMRTAPEFAPDPSIKPGPSQADDWWFDLAMVIEGDALEDGDDLRIDLAHTCGRLKVQRYKTRPWPLTRPGRAELQVLHGVIAESIYSFEVKENSPAMITLLTPLIGLVGAGLTLLVQWLIHEFS